MWAHCSLSLLLFLLGFRLIGDTSTANADRSPSSGRADRFVYLTNPAGAADLGDAEPVSTAVAVVRGEVLVRFRPGVLRVRQQSLLAPWAASLKFFQPAHPVQVQTRSSAAPHSSALQDLAVVKVEEKADLNRVLAYFRSQPEVLYAEPNYRLRLAQATPEAVFPNDFDFAQLWGLHNVGQGDGKAGADLGMPEAWRYGTGDRGTTVAVIDTGIDYYHPDLAANVWVNPGEIEGNGVDDDGNGYVDDVHGYDFVSHDGDPMDDHGHGTHVSGTIGAVGNNAIGVVGVCWQTSLMGIKAFDESGNGDVRSAIEGIQYAIQTGARIINASWGDSEYSRALEDAVHEAYLAGVLFVAAAGNNNTDRLFYPAAHNHVIAVAATDSKDHRSRFSSWGSFVDLAAPGENIYSTMPNNAYGFFSGTSMATPHVSGVAALVLARHPEFTVDQVETILRNAVDTIPADQPIGTGRLNALKAVRVNTPLPEVKLNLPGTIYGDIDIPGTATGNQFVSYSLEYGPGTNPTNWTAFYRSSTPVPGGTLFSNFPTSPLGDGTFTFRLTAENAAGERAVERASVRVSNVHISSPNHEDIRRAGERIDIVGTVYGEDRHYRIEYGEGPQPAAWSEAGIELTAGGRERIREGVLATWDTSQVPPNRFYTLKLTATAADGSVSESIVRLVYLDSQLKPGWPQSIPVTGTYPLEDWRQLTVADIDQDGFDEILIVQHGNSEGQPARLLVYRHDGSLFWSQELVSGAPYSDTPVVGDTDGDGFLEVFVDVGDPPRLFAFHHDGTPLGGAWPVRLQAGGLGKVLADLDGDGNLELIGYSQGTVGGAGYLRQLVVFDRTGRLLQQWDVPACSTDLDTPRILPAVANLDDEPGLEIAAVSGCSSLAVFRLSRPSAPLWTAETYGTFVSSPVIGDLDGDGHNEVVIAAYDLDEGSRGGVYAFDHRGQRLPGWPVLVEESFAATPALGDADGDGQMEISIPCWKSGLLHLLRRDGFEVEGWPVGPVKESSVKSSPVMGDVDGDGRPDIVLSSPGYTSQLLNSGDFSRVGGIKAWTPDGHPIPLNPGRGLWPLVMESPSGVWMKAAPATLADIDHNGKLDIIAATIQDRTYLPLGEKANWKFRGSLYVWELNVPYVAERMPWPAFQQNPQHTGFLPRPPHVDQPPVVTGMPDQVIPPGAAFFPIELDQYVEDPDNSPAQITWTATGGRDLTVSISAKRVASIILPSDTWVGTDTLRFEATDPAGLHSDASVTFEVRPGYVPPLARPDSVTTPEDVPVDVDVLANDTDPSGNPLRVSSFSRPALGTVTKTAASTLLYKPKPDANGTDTFSYVLTNDQGGFSIGSVTVTILPVNDPPLANPDHVIIDEDTPCDIDVLGNDTDPDNDSLTLSNFAQPENGSLSRNPDSTLHYVPKRDFSGPDSFTYTIADSQGVTNQGLVSLIIKPVNDPPVAENQSLALNRNSSVTVAFKASDPDDTEFTFTVLEGPAHGELWNYPTVATYYPTNGYSGSDRFTYQANDGKENGPIATVLLSVLDVNNPPLAERQSILTKVDQPAPVHLAATDLDGDPLTYSITSQPVHGSLTGSGTNYVYVPETGFLGHDEFTYEASDGQDSSPPAIVSITVTDQNTPPVAQDLWVRVLVNTPTNITLQATDPESNPLSFHVVSRPSHGKITGKGQVLVYSPNPYFSGSDRFTFKADDGELESNSGTVTLSVEPPNHPPVSTNQEVVVTMNTPTSITLAVQDVDGNELRCPILKGPQYGLLSGLGTRFTYVPKPDYLGSDRFTYKAWDGQTYSRDAVVSITVSAAPPPVDLAFSWIKMLPDGQVQLTLKTTSHQAAEVMVSTNLLDWTPLATPLPNGASTVFIDPDAPAHPQRFYRARLLPQDP
jgi:subtilisin family serine protease